MTQVQFRTLFVLGPALASSIAPTLLFGLIAGQWGSNLLWGSVFGLGWCLGATYRGGLVHNGGATTIGLAYAWLILIPLYFASGWLWRSLDERGRRKAVWLLFLSFLPMVPAKTIMSWHTDNLHPPDFSLHLATSF